MFRKIFENLLDRSGLPPPRSAPPNTPTQHPPPPAAIRHSSKVDRVICALSRSLALVRRSSRRRLGTRWRWYVLMLRILGDTRAWCRRSNLANLSGESTVVVAPGGVVGTRVSRGNLAPDHSGRQIFEDFWHFHGQANFESDFRKSCPGPRGRGANSNTRERQRGSGHRGATMS